MLQQLHSARSMGQCFAALLLTLSIGTIEEQHDGVSCCLSSLYISVLPYSAALSACCHSRMHAVINQDHQHCAIVQACHISFAYVSCCFGCSE